MSVCAAVFTPPIECPDNLKTYNKDGSRIDPDDEKYPRPQSELGSQGVLNATLKAAKERQEQAKMIGGGERKASERKASVDSGLSGVTLTNDQKEKKKLGLFKKIAGHNSSK